MSVGLSFGLWEECGMTGTSESKLQRGQDRIRERRKEEFFEISVYYEKITKIEVIDYFDVRAGNTYSESRLSSKQRFS